MSISIFASIINEEGGLTGLGYGVYIAAAIVILIIAGIIAGKRSGAKAFSIKQLAFCSMALALAVITSYIKIWSLPWGGAITLCSMLFIVLIAYWYGPSTGILVGLVYGIIQFIQEPYFLTFFQVCCDYILAFAALGVAGFFRKLKHGLVIGYIVAVLARGIFHVIGGYLYWMEYMPENFPKQFAMIYPFAYNYAFLLAEAVITVIIISIPAVRDALKRVNVYALNG